MKNWINRSWINVKYWIKKKYKLVITVVVIGICSVPFVAEIWFFEEHTTIAKKLKYVGVFIGGVLAIINAYFIYKRTKELNRSNKLVVKGQLDTRFKDAATLLAQENTSANLSGIYALHQIAIEASETEKQEDYVKIIKDILTTFIKANSVIEYRKIEKESILLQESKDLIINTVAYNTKNNIVLQTIIDKLFIDNGCEIYEVKCLTDLTDISKTVLKEINFFSAKLKYANFSESQLQYAKFGKALLENTNFRKAKLQNVDFRRAELQYADFRWTQLQNANFGEAQIQNVNFGEAQLQNANFEKSQLQNARFRKAQLQNTRFGNTQLQSAQFDGAQLQNTYFGGSQLQNVRLNGAYSIDKAIFYNTSWNEKTNFSGTAFENKTVEELTKIMGNPPEPLEEKNK